MKIFNKLFNNKKTEKSDSLIIEEKDYQEIVNTVTKASNIMKKPTKMKKSSTIEKSRKKQLKNQYKESVARSKYDDRGFDENGIYLPYCNKEGKIIFNSSYDFAGYDVDGYDANGYNREGYNREGYDKYGYDKDGYDRYGYDSEGYNRSGINIKGFNRNGLHLNGTYFDNEGYGSDGFNIEGLDREGYNRGGYNKEGYDREGYDKDGFDKFGFDREGYDKDGFDKEGYNREGFNRKGYDREGFNKLDYDIKGYGRDGFNISGYDREGYDREGYNKQGYNRQGYDRNGFDREGYDRRGFDKDGFDRQGYNVKGEYKEYIINYFRKNTNIDIDSNPEKDKLINKEVLKMLTTIKDIDNSINIIDNYHGALNQTRSLVEVFSRELLSTSELITEEELIKIKGINLPVNKKNTFFMNLLLIEKYKLLSDNEIDLLHKIRKLGNDSIHEIEFTKEDAIYYFDNVRSMVNKWIESVY